MPKHEEQASNAFSRGIDHDFQLQKKTAKNRRSGNTKEHLLLDKPDARAIREYRVKAFTSKASRVIDWRDIGDTALTLNERKTVGAILGRSRRQKSTFSSLASNPLGRSVFFDAMLEALAPIHADPDVTMFFATFVDEQWCLAKDALTFDTYSMMRRSKRALLDIGYHGLLILEIQVLVGLKGIGFMPHLHGFIWRRGKVGMGSKNAAKHLNKRFSGIRKATGVTLSLMPQRWPKSLITRFYYATKLPIDANSYIPIKGDPHTLVTLPEPMGKMKKAANQNHTNMAALRISAMLGQYEIDDTVFAVGEGTKVRKAASKALTAKLQKLKIKAPCPGPMAVRRLCSKALER